MSATTPCTVVSRSMPKRSSANRGPRPTACASGYRNRAVEALTTTSGVSARSSAASKRRPACSGVPSASKKPGVTAPNDIDKVSSRVSLRNRRLIVVGASVGGSRLPSPAASTPGSLLTSASSRSTNPADAPSSAKRESPSISLAISTREESKPPSSASSASMLRARSPAPARSTTAVDTCATTSAARRRRAVGVAAGPAPPEGPSRWPRGIPAVDAAPQATAATSDDAAAAASSIGSSNWISAARGSTAAALVANRRTAAQARK